MDLNPNDIQDVSQENFTLKGMLTQLGINIGFSALALLAFSVFRPRNKIVYAPKSKYIRNESKQPPPIGSGLFDWIKPVVKSPEDLLIDKIGYDAVLFIRTVSFFFRMFAIFTIISIFITIPINIVATLNTNDGNIPDEPVKLLSISGIKGEKTSLWFIAHILITWIFSIITLRLLLGHYHLAISLSRRYFQSDEYLCSLHSRTLIALNLEHIKSDEELELYMKRYRLKYPIHEAHLGHEIEDLSELIKKHENNVRKLEIALAQYLKGPNKLASKRPVHRIGGYLWWGGRKVDSIDHYTRKIQKLEERIATAREEVARGRKVNYGFLMFANSIQAHGTARKLENKDVLSRLNLDPPSVFMAPEPKDILWDNIRLNHHARRTKRIIGNLLFTGFCFLWAIPLSFISSLAHVRKIIEIFPQSSEFMEKNKFIATLIESTLSPLIMLTIVLILPSIFRILSKQQGALTKSSLDRQVLSKLYLFFLVNNLIYYTMFSTLIFISNEIHNFLERNPGISLQQIFKQLQDIKIFDQISKSLVNTATYWINYISLRNLSVMLDLAQVASLIIIWMRKNFTNPTPRQLRELTRPHSFQYPIYYNLLIFTMTVGLVYSVIAPLILPFCAVYFAVTYIVLRYQLLYVCQTKVETGGRMWRVVFNRILASTLLFQLLMLATVNMKASNRLYAIALAPLPFLTIAFKVYCRKRLDPLARYFEMSATEQLVGKPCFRPGGGQLSQRFGHPALYCDLPTPMVHANVKHMLAEVYSGRMEEEVTVEKTTGYVRHSTVKHLSMLDSTGVRFQTVEEDELLVDDSREGLEGYYKDAEFLDDYIQAPGSRPRSDNASEYSFSYSPTKSPYSDYLELTEMPSFSRLNSDSSNPPATLLETEDAGLIQHAQDMAYAHTPLHSPVSIATLDTQIPPPSNNEIAKSPQENTAGGTPPHAQLLNTSEYSPYGGHGTVNRQQQQAPSQSNHSYHPACAQSLEQSPLFSGRDIPEENATSHELQPGAFRAAP
ncbi:uncharacterized protein VTP21DRAFT_8527 [Calcarisporiella thermophila]|uniref:uncharacterized protein n=1 Tax=Calcarisporiella thermophila TaxID=911321 RepID=UPI003744AB9C